MLHIARIYESDQGKGVRILVDRLWPRGISKEEAHLDEWLKEIAPTDELRNWFGHDPAKWPEFQERYTKELEANKEMCEKIRAYMKKGEVVLLYGAKDEEHNNAVVLKNYLEQS